MKPVCSARRICLGCDIYPLDPLLCIDAFVLT